MIILNASSSDCLFGAVKLLTVLVLIRNAFGQEGRMSYVCGNRTVELKAGVSQAKLWALRVEDANGRPGSGVLVHRLTWLGSYDQCLNFDNPVLEPKDPDKTSQDRPSWVTQYCLASVTFKQFGTETAHVGVCVPEGCDDNDVQLHMQQTRDGGIPGQQDLGLEIKSVDRVKCKERETKWGPGPIVVTFFLCLFVTISLHATFYHWLVARSPTTVTRSSSRGPTDLAHLIKGRPVSSDTAERTTLLNRKSKGLHESGSRFQRIAVCFSIQNGLRRLFHDESQGQVQGQVQGQTFEAPEVLPSLHGLRVLSLLWVIQGHVYYYTSKVPTVNLQEAWDYTKRGLLFQAVLNSGLAGDTFFFISGLLMCYHSLRYMATHQRMVNPLKLCMHRYWRLTPLYLLVLVLFTFLVPVTDSGPLWSVMDDFTDQCTTRLWANLVYINNFLFTDSPCMEWTWYLAADMQFYLVAVIFLFAFRFVPAIGLLLCVMMVVVAGTLTGVVATHSHIRLPPSSLQQFSSTSYWSDYFIKPYCRAAPYFVGVGVAYLLHTTKGQLRMSSASKVMTSVVVAVVCPLVIFGTVGVANGTHITQSASSFYLATSHVIWAGGVAWVTIVCCTKNGGLLSRVLSWKGWVPLSRLSYAAYLVHPIILLSHLLSLHSPFFINAISMSFAFSATTVYSFGAAFALYLFVESPFASLEKLIFGS